jgi:hypothetical protein
MAAGGGVLAGLSARFPAARAVLLLAFLGACAVSLAPAYDPALVERLNTANEKTLTLFSAVSDGSPASAFPGFADRYDELIGAFDAARMQAAAREVPALSQRALAVVGGTEACPVPDDCVNPTPAILGTVAANLARMRATHAARGLGPDVVDLFKNAHETSMMQALEVENAFNRN